MHYTAFTSLIYHQHSSLIASVPPLRTGSNSNDLARPIPLAATVKQCDGWTMTSDSVGSQSLRVANPAHFRPNNPSTVPFRHLTLQSFNRELWNPKSHSTGSDRASASASKRRKTGNGKALHFVVPGNLYAREEPKDWRTESRFKPARSAGSDSPSRCDDLELTKRWPQNFPQRPRRSSSRIGDTQKDNIALENVQTKPYVARPPVSAPNFRNCGRSTCTMMGG